MEQNQRKGTFERKIEGISELKSQPIYGSIESEEIRMGEIEWVFYVFKEIDRYQIRLFSFVDYKIAVDADYEIKMISKREGVEDIRKSGASLFTADDGVVEIYEADGNKILDFVENDAIEFKVSFGINRVANIDCGNLDFFRKPTKMSDGVLNVYEEKLYINKQFLSLHSGFFEKLFSNTETKNEFELKGEEYSVIVELLRFIYGDDLLLVDKCQQNWMLELAEKYEMPHIFHVYSNYLLKQTKIEEKYICEMFRIANKFKSAELQNHLLNLMTKEDMVKVLWKDFELLSANAKQVLAERIEKWDSPKEVENGLISETSCNVIDFSKPTKFSDVVLVVEGKKIHISKTLLAVYSPVFEAMFFSDFKEKNQNEIELKELEYDSFIDLLNLIYPQSEILIGEDNLEDILQLADKFDIQMARHLCEEYLLRTTQIENLEKLKMAEKWSLNKFQRRLLKSWKSKDIENLMECEEFENLKMETIKSIMHYSLRLPFE